MTDIKELAREINYSVSLFQEVHSKTRYPDDALSYAYRHKDYKFLKRLHSFLNVGDDDE